jgi:hypothetical protein
MFEAIGLQEKGKYKEQMCGEMIVLFVCNLFFKYLSLSGIPVESYNEHTFLHLCGTSESCCQSLHSNRTRSKLRFLLKNDSKESVMIQARLIVGSSVVHCHYGGLNHGYYGRELNIIVILCQCSCLFLCCAVTYVENTTKIVNSSVTVLLNVLLLGC